MSYTGPLEERIRIRELVETYGDAVARGDPEAWALCWDIDGKWEIFGQTLVGRANIVQFWTSIMDQFEFAGFNTALGAIEVTGQRAMVRAYTAEELFLSDGSVRRIRGRYDDQVIKQDGQWVFGCRSYTVLHDRSDPTAGSNCADG